MSVSDLSQTKENALASLHTGKLAEARHWLDRGLALDFEDKAIVAMLKGVAFWEDRLKRLQSARSDMERADRIMEYWSTFTTFAERYELRDEKTLYAFRSLAFATMQGLLLSYNTPEGGRNPEVLWRMGLCYKLLGNFDSARKFLEAALRLDQEHPVILAELADVHALLGQEDIAKLLFREAFYHDPSRIHLDTLESELIRRLIAQVQEQRIPPAEVPYWVPIVAILGGVFTSSREIRPLEFGKLKQSVYALERDYQEHPARRSILTPLLLNRYFWMLEHARGTGQPRHVVAEILLKIESLHPVVYKLYTS